MSLTVSSDLLEKAQRGPVDNADFIACIKDSLPYAWEVISEVAQKARASESGFDANEVPPPGEQERGQLLRLVGSDAMRAAVEQHFGMRLAFQNCHKVALFTPEAGAAHAEFVTPRAQLLNQSPELVDC